MVGGLLSGRETHGVPNGERSQRILAQCVRLPERHKGVP